MATVWQSRVITPVLASILTIAGAWGVAPAAYSAERLTIRIGPVERSLSISDLERFVKTGKVSSALEPFGDLLTLPVREALSRRIKIDPNVGDGVVDEIFRSVPGNRLLQALLLAIPDSTAEQIKAAVKLAAGRANGLSPLGILQAFPGQNITVDVTSAVAVASRLNLDYLEGQIISSVLKRELTVETEPFNPTFDPAASGSETVQVQSLTLEDRQRNRTIPVDIYWSGNTSGPLVVMSHGYGADRSFLEYLARHLASHGITVATLDHPGSNSQWLTSIPLSIEPSKLISPEEFVDRPKDVSFLLDELAKLNGQQGYLQGKLNTEQVVVLGHSLGGYTALALAGGELDIEGLRRLCQKRLPLGEAPADWAQCAAAGLSDKRLNLRDRRISGAIALNPAVGQLFGDKGLSKLEVPILMLAGTDDSWAPAVSHQLRPFTEMPKPKYIITAIDTTHFSVGDPEDPSRQQGARSFGPEPPSEQTEPLRELVRGASLAFINQLTPQAKTYAPFLTPAYAQSLSTEKLPLRLNTEFPEKLVRWLESSDLPIGRKN